MLRLSRNHTPRGMSAAVLRTWGYICLLLGVAAKGLIQNGMLGLGNMTSQQLLEVMNQSDSAMALVSISLVLQALEACAVPIFAFLLVEGFQKTSSYKNYLLRVLLVAVVSEIPYNLAFSSHFFVMDSRNPAFGLVLGLLMLYFYRYCSARSFKNTLIKAFVTLSAILWCEMLRIEHGSFTILMTAVLWLMRSRVNFRTFAACGAAALANIISLYYFAAPFSCLLLHFYNDEKGESNRTFNLICYPLMLLVAGIAAFLI